MFGRILAALLFVWLFTGVVEADAEKTDRPFKLDEVVVSATMTEKLISDAPGSVEVITAREIQDMNALTVAQALKSAAGLFVSLQSGRVRVPGIRGARSKHTLVLLDGRRLAFGFNDMIDVRQIPTFMVERIEIVRGPASALYGSDALGGVVNIITKSPPREWSGMATAQYGVNRDGDGREHVGGFMLGGPVERFRALIAAELRQKDGWDKNGKLPDDGFKEDPRFAASRFAFDVMEGQVLSGGIDYAQNNYTGDMSYENLVRERKADEERLGYFLQYDAHLMDVHHVMLRLNRSQFRYNNEFVPFAASGERHTEQYTNQAELRYSGLWFGDHQFTLGGELRREGLDDTQEGIRTDRDVDNISVFLQNEFHLFDPLYVVLGLRYDHHSQFGGQWTPRGSVIYSLNDFLRLKGSFGQSFRAPSLTELFVTSQRRRGRDVYEPNSNLKAEKSTSYEIGIEGEYDIFRGALTGYYTEVDNLIESVFDRFEGQGADRKTFYQYRNIGEVTLKGIEVEGGVILPMGFSLDGNFAWMDVQNKSGGEDTGGYPEYKAYVKLGYELPRHQLRANLNMSYIGRLTYADGERFSYPLFGAQVRKGLGPNLELFAGVDNIFDERVERDDVVQIEPTTFYTGITMKF